MMLGEPQWDHGGSLQSTRSPQDVCWAGPQDSAHAVPSAWLTRLWPSFKTGSGPCDPRQWGYLVAPTGLGAL